MNWSLSKLGTFTKCRRRFLYAYIQQRPGAKGAAAQRGVDQHAIIEDYFLGKTDSLPSDLGHYKEWFDSLRLLTHNAELQLALLEGWLPAAWEDPKAWWKGVLDLLVRREGTAWLFDWKTGKIYPDHLDQKKLYAIAVFISYPDIQEIIAHHVYLDLLKQTKDIFQREQLPALIKYFDGKLVPYMAAMDSYKRGDDPDSFFVTNPSYLCNYCPYSKAPCPH
jgi:hypothetical protein